MTRRADALSTAQWVALRRLPRAVRRSVWRQYRHLLLRSETLETLGRLARLDPGFWALKDAHGQPVDWLVHARRVDTAARVRPVARNRSDERNLHDLIAQALDKAAGALTRDGQPDPTLHSTLHALARRGSGSFSPFVPDPAKFEATAEVRLSDFLRAAADWFDGSLGVQTFGLHRIDDGTQSPGADGAAAVAATQLVALMRECTGRPQERWVNHLVKLYHPHAKDGRNWARSAAQRAASKHAEK